jgi:hypothetical protein
MNASMQMEHSRMETHRDFIKCRRAPPPRRARRLLARLGALAIAIAVATVIVIGQRWLLEDGPASAIKLGLAAHAAEATRSN